MVKTYKITTRYIEDFHFVLKAQNKKEAKLKAQRRMKRELCNDFKVYKIKEIKNAPKTKRVLS